MLTPTECLSFPIPNINCSFERMIYINCENDINTIRSEGKVINISHETTLFALPKDYFSKLYKKYSPSVQ